ncbi:MAG: hypothetical protein PVG38_14325, partial [Gammaproteobacteria bacterium]
MTSKRMIAAGAALLFPMVAGAMANDEIEALRREIHIMREEYEARLRALELRLREAETAVQAAEARPESVATPPQPEYTQSVEPDPESQGIISPLGFNEFNPALSIILQGSVNSYTRDPEDYELSGFQLGGEAGLSAEGFTLDETEITASANVDPLFYAATTIALHDDEQETEVEVEEAFVDPLLLPAGLGVRFGRFYSDVGYLNRFHSHAWDFHDAPLANQAFLGEQYRDDGIRLTWTAPTDLYLMLGAETLAGG